MKFLCLVKSGGSLVNKRKSLGDLFQVILSNGFPRLRICTATGIGSLDSNEIWTGSPALRHLILDVRTPLAYDKIRSVCSNLRQFQSASPSFSQLPINHSSHGQRLLTEITKLKEWESKKKFILEYCSLFDTDKSLASSRNANSHSYSSTQEIIRGRIFPDKEPYCFASFLLEIQLTVEYPFKMHQATILDPIYHPNVHENGTNCACWGIDDDVWQPTNPLINVIKAILHLIDNPKLDHACNAECAHDYCNNYEKFYDKALHLTLNQ